MNSLDDWLSTEQAAGIANYHPDHIRRLIRKGEIQARRWGNAWMIDKNSLLEYLNRVDVQGERRGPKRTKFDSHKS